MEQIISKELEEAVNQKTKEMRKEKFIKEQRFLFIFLACLVIALGVWYFTRSKAEKVILSCWWSYHSYWKLDDVTQNPDTGDIKAVFNYKSYDKYHEDWLKSIEKPYRKLAEKFPDNVVSVTFDCKDALIGFTQESDGLYVYSMQNIERLPVREVAEMFPETKKLCWYIWHGDIEEIQGFENLESIGISPEITTQERQKIKELFPNCEIFDSAYDLLATYHLLTTAGENQETSTKNIDTETMGDDNQ